MKTISCQNRQYQYNESNKLGSGAFADVFKGSQLGSNEQVAIKVIRKKAMEKYGEDIIQAIGSEVNILQQISQMSASDPSPFIVKIFDCFETTNHIYIILEYCNSGNLLELSRKRKKENNRFTEQECINIIYQVTCAIEYLARYNITHRDIKPENIFINDGVYKLGDFGFASQKSLYQTTLGTYPYMAPEFFTSNNYDKSIDVWAVGVMYHEILFDELYFIGQSQFEVSKKIIEKPYIIQKAHLISQQSQEFLKRCIDKNATTRITAAEAVNLPLFDQVKNDPKIQQLFMKADPIVEAVQNIRNGCFFLYELGEMLELQDSNLYKFEIFYLYKTGLMKLLDLGNNLCQKIQPKNIVNNDPQKWQQFVTSQNYKNVGNLLNNDREIITDKFYSYCEQMTNFINQNYGQNAQHLFQIINDDLEKEIQEDLFKSQINDAFQIFLGKFQANPDKNSLDARQQLLTAFMLATACNIEQTIVNRFLDFQEFQAQKHNYTTQDILNKITSIKI